MTKIQWAEQVWNPVVGCTPVSPGCLNCYAARMSIRLAGMGTAGYGPREGRPAHTVTENGAGRPVSGSENRPTTVRIAEVRGGRPVFTGDVRCLPDQLDKPLRRRTPTVWFVNSMSDLFHEAVPDEFLDQVFAAMALCPQHTFVVLTKRPERAEEYLGLADRDRALEASVLAWHCAQGPAYRLSNALPVHPLNVAESLRVRMLKNKYRWPLPNVWIGASVEDHSRADERVPIVVRLGAAGWKTCLSVEPLLGPVDLTTTCITPPGWTGDPAYAYPGHAGIDLVIVGGESGPKARPCELRWIRGVVAQCDAGGVPAYVKQLGSNPHLSEYIGIFDPKGGDPAEWPEDLRGRACVPGMWAGTHRRGAEGTEMSTKKGGG